MSHLLIDNPLYVLGCITVALLIFAHFAKEKS